MPINPGGTYDVDKTVGSAILSRADADEGPALYPLSDLVLTSVQVTSKNKTRSLEYHLENCQLNLFPGNPLFY